MTAAKYEDALDIVAAVEEGNTSRATQMDVAMARVLIEQASDIAALDVGGSTTGDAANNPTHVRLSDGSASIATLPVSIASAVPVTDNGGSLTVDGTVAVSGTVSTSNTPVAASTGAATSVAMTASSATLIAANANRIGLIIYNPLSVTLYVRFENADAAAVQSFWVRAGETYELPPRYYTGIVKAALASSTGNVFVTELT